jgi:anaphase-promoting complex subunit 2
MLVDIYGSKELFINEYRTMLAEKLLSKSNYDAEREMHALELLKLRFGETSLHNCEVMLKDFSDSKRANANIKTKTMTGTPSIKDLRTSELLSQTPVEATIVSSLYWPAFSSDLTEFKLPVEIQEHMDAYAGRYQQLKAPRKMEWKPSLGTVVMDVEHNGRTFEVSVNPLQASILYLFQNKPVWSASDLARELGLNADTLRRRIVLWLNNGVLLERRDGHGTMYSVAAPSDEFDDMDGVHDDDEHVSAVASAEETAAAGMMVYEQYVMGMLTNFPSLPLDRIHNMLKMFVVEPVYDKSVEELDRFLQELVTQDKLAMDGASFSKKK